MNVLKQPSHNVYSITQIHVSGHESHWMPHSYGLVPYLSKMLSKLLHVPDHSLFYANSFIKVLTNWFAQLAGAVEYTDCFSAEGYNPTPRPENKNKTSVLDLTLNNLMVRLL